MKFYTHHAMIAVLFSFCALTPVNADDTPCRSTVSSSKESNIKIVQSGSCTCYTSNGGSYAGHRSRDGGCSCEVKRN